MDKGEAISMVDREWVAWLVMVHGKYLVISLVLRL